MFDLYYPPENDEKCSLKRDQFFTRKLDKFHLKLTINVQGIFVTRWWFQICFFPPYLGTWSNLTNIFQMGWNHQLGKKYLTLPVWSVHGNSRQCLFGRCNVKLQKLRLAPVLKHQQQGFEPVLCVWWGFKQGKKIQRSTVPPKRSKK